jgi:hypothetical protein
MYHSLGYKSTGEYKRWGAFGGYFGLTMDEIWHHYSAPEDDQFRRVIYELAGRKYWGITLEDYPEHCTATFVKAVLDSARDVHAEDYEKLWSDDEQIGWMKTTFGQLVGFLVDWGLITPELAEEYDIDALIAMQEDGDELI